MILVDTGPIVAAASKRDQHHETCLTALRDLREAALITPLVPYRWTRKSVRAKQLVLQR